MFHQHRQIKTICYTANMTSTFWERVDNESRSTVENANPLFWLPFMLKASEQFHLLNFAHIRFHANSKRSVCRVLWPYRYYQQVLSLFKFESSYHDRNANVHTRCRCAHAPGTTSIYVDMYEKIHKQKWSKDMVYRIIPILPCSSLISIREP